MDKTSFRTIGEIAVVASGNAAPQDPKDFVDGGEPFIRTSDVGSLRFGEILSTRDRLGPAAAARLRRFPRSTILFPKSGASTFLNHRVIMGMPGYVASHLAAITPDDRIIDPRYLLYCLATVRSQDLVQDHAYPSLTLGQIAAISVPVPSLREQRRIVESLDAAYVAIDELRATTEAAVGLTRRVLDEAIGAAFLGSGQGWQRTTVGAQISLQRGFDITKAEQREGIVPVVSSGGVRSSHDTAMVKAPGVVIGRKGTLGTVFYLEEDFWPHDTTLWVKDFRGNDPRLVYFLLRSLDLARLDSGAANPALNRNKVHPLEISWPAGSLQLDLATSLDEIESLVRGLLDVYQAKLRTLAEFRESILRHFLFQQSTLASAEDQARSTSSERVGGLL